MPAVEDAVQVSARAQQAAASCAAPENTQTVEGTAQVEAPLWLRLEVARRLPHNVLDWESCSACRICEAALGWRLWVW